MNHEEPEFHGRCDRCGAIGGVWMVRHLLVCWRCKKRGA